MRERRDFITLGEGLLILVIGLASFSLGANLRLIAKAIVAASAGVVCTCHVERPEAP